NTSNQENKQLHSFPTRRSSDLLWKGRAEEMARDEFVQSAIDNCAPRFVSNGVDANDFQRVTNSIERWVDWCQKWSECGAMHEQMGERAEAEGHYESAAHHYFHAAICYHFGKYLFVR